MIITDSDTLKYLLHRVGEEKISSRAKFYRKSIDGNVESPDFLSTFGNNDITAYVGFIDLYGFSSIVQGKSPKEIRNYLNPFLIETVNILTNCNALVDKMIGDEIMFVLPETEEESNPYQILLLGQIMGALHDLAFNMQPNYKFRIGLSYGKVNVFNLKGNSYSEWSILGEPIHVAKRLHGLSELKCPNPVCGGFGLAQNKQTREELLNILEPKLNIIAGFASRFSNKIMDNPLTLKGVGKFVWAYLYPK